MVSDWCERVVECSAGKGKLVERRCLGKPFASLSLRVRQTSIGGNSFQGDRRPRVMGWVGWYTRLVSIFLWRPPRPFRLYKGILDAACIARACMQQINLEDRKGSYQSITFSAFPFKISIIILINLFLKLSLSLPLEASLAVHASSGKTYLPLFTSCPMEI